MDSSLDMSDVTTRAKAFFQFPQNQLASSQRVLASHRIITLSNIIGLKYLQRACELILVISGQGPKNCVLNQTQALHKLLDDIFSVFKTSGCSTTGSNITSVQLNEKNFC